MSADRTNPLRPGEWGNPIANQADLARRRSGRWISPQLRRVLVALRKRLGFDPVEPKYDQEFTETEIELGLALIGLVRAYAPDVFKPVAR